MTGGNLLVGHDHHHHQHFQQEQKLQEPDSVPVLKEQLQLFDNQEREKQLLELQTKMDEVYFFFSTLFYLKCFFWQVPAGWKEKIATIEMNSVKASINEDRKT